MPLAEITLNDLSCAYTTHPESGMIVSGSICSLEARDVRRDVSDCRSLVLSRGNSKYNVILYY